MNARQAALQTLIAYRREGAWSESYLKRIIRENNMDTRDAALATTISYGVLQNMTLLDFYIDSLSSVKKINPKIRDILRIGAYQIINLDRIPDSAAVNEAVKMARKDNAKAAGFVNAILRKLSASKASLPIPGGTKAEKLSVITSHPKWIVDKFIEIFNEQAEDILIENNTVPEITARVNTLLCDTEEAIEKLAEQDVCAIAHKWMPDCIVIKNPGNVEELFAYKEGLITVQDVASQICALSAEAAPGMNVLDACAAPGGKSFVLAQQLKDRGNICSCDIHEHKINILNRGKKRLKVTSVTATLQDASEFKSDWENKFDVVLADVPCSGLGIIRKKPDIRYKKKEEIAQLPALQKKILNNVSRYVKPGGILIYSTCTILPEENSDIVCSFMSENNQFHLKEFMLPGINQPVNGEITLLPTIHGTDGFYICKMQREN